MKANHCRTCTCEVAPRPCWLTLAIIGVCLAGIALGFTVFFMIVLPLARLQGGH